MTNTPAPRPRDNRIVLHNGQHIVAWRLDERPADKQHVPVCTDHKCEWDANGETLRCAVCGIDCT